MKAPSWGWGPVGSQAEGGVGSYWGHVLLMEEHNGQEDQPNIQVYVMSAMWPSPGQKEQLSQLTQSLWQRWVKKMRNQGEFLIYEATESFSFVVSLLFSTQSSIHSEVHWILSELHTSSLSFSNRKHWVEKKKGETPSDLWVTPRWWWSRAMTSTRESPLSQTRFPCVHVGTEPSSWYLTGVRSFVFRPKQ